GVVEVGGQELEQEPENDRQQVEADDDLDQETAGIAEIGLSHQLVPVGCESSRDRVAAASTARSKADSTPASTSALTPCSVVPPGEVTFSRSRSRLSSLPIARVAAPSAVCVHSRRATAASSPWRSAARHRASITRKK